MDVTRITAIAERRHGLVTAAELIAEGALRSDLVRLVERGWLVRVAHGVYRAAGCPDSLEGRILASVLVHGPATFASHRTAAWLWGLPGFARPGRVEVVRPSGRSNVRTAVQVHRSSHLPEHHTARVGVIPVTSMARTLFDLAGIVGAKPLGRAVESALRTPSCTVGALYRVTEELGGRGRAGTPVMRTVLEDRGRGYVPTESELDLLGRSAVASIGGIEWQVEMGDEQGDIRHVDGLHRTGRLVIEWDGAEFHDRPEQRALDAEGDRRLCSLGLEVVRYRWADVTRRPAQVRREVAQHVALPVAVAA